VRVHTGTSGFSYGAWKGSFYPEDLPAHRMLSHYASRLRTVEANVTFYRLPRPEALAAWRSQVPEEFVFALKAPQRVTHLKRLRDVDDAMAAFYRAAAELGQSLGPILYQLPPAFRKDLPRLCSFLDTLPGGGRAAFEFRHPSWFCDEVFEALSAHGAALCIAESDDATIPLIATAAYGYLRLRRADYGAQELRAWAERILGQRWAEAFVYFKHEDAARGPALALALSQILDSDATSISQHS
jgi:uncharacterized protein YecE (DUF72 family)